MDGLCCIMQQSMDELKRQSCCFKLEHMQTRGLVVAMACSQCCRTRIDLRHSVITLVSDVVRDNDENTPLHIACLSMAAAVAHRLILYGADVEVRNKDVSRLWDRQCFPFAAHVCMYDFVW